LAARLERERNVDRLRAPRYFSRESRSCSCPSRAHATSGGGFFLTTSQFGPNFYIGNNPSADGTYQSLRFGRGAPEFERQDATELAEATRSAARLSPAEVSSFLGRHGARVHHDTGRRAG
jgi:hypothetical protein